MRQGDIYVAFLGWFKKLFLIILVALFLAGAAEIGLRITTVLNLNSPATTAKTSTNPLLVPSWQHQYQLRPLALVQSRNPDSNQPIELKINEWGTRNEAIVVPKPNSTFRILCLGDESTFAPMVLQQQTFSAELHRMLQPMVKGRGELEVINAGVPGHCPLLASLQLKHSLIALQPDLVIYHFDMSDIADDYQARPHLLVEQGEIKGCPHPSLAQKPQQQQQICEQVLLIKAGAQYFAETVGKEDSQNIKNEIGIPQGRLAWIRDQPVDWQIYIEHALEPLVAMQHLCQKSGAQFTVSCIPQPWQVSANASDGPGVRTAVGLQSGKMYSNSYPFDQVSKYCQEHQIPLHNPVSYFRQQPQNENLFLKNAATFSPRGHQFYAYQLANYVYQQYTRPASSEAKPPPNSQRR